MNGKIRLLVVLVVAVALLAAFVPAAGFAEGNRMYFSGLECVYVLVPGQPEIHGNTMHIIDQVNQNLFFSNDPDVLPNGVNTAHINLMINMVTMTGTGHAAAIFEPDGATGSWVGIGTFQADFAAGALQGRGVVQGTGEFAGLTMWQDMAKGNVADCPGTAWDATTWYGFIVPAQP
jgi:hypothetical protein